MTAKNQDTFRSTSQFSIRLGSISRQEISMTEQIPTHAKRIFLAPAPRRVREIFDEEDLARLSRLGELIVHEEGPVTDAVFEEKEADATIIIGQIDLPRTRLDRAQNLRAVINVEVNFVPNIDYEHAFRRGIRVLNVSPVFAEPVAEVALGMALD